MSNQKRWTMRNGSKVRIIDMDDSHILNCLQMLETAFKRVCETPGVKPERFTNGVADCYPIYVDFKNEAKRRGI